MALTQFMTFAPEQNNTPLCHYQVLFWNMSLAMSAPLFQCSMSLIIVNISKLHIIHKPSDLGMLSWVIWSALLHVFVVVNKPCLVSAVS